MKAKTCYSKSSATSKDWAKLRLETILKKTASLNHKYNTHSDKTGISFQHAITWEKNECMYLHLHRHKDGTPNEAHEYPWIINTQNWDNNS